MPGSLETKLESSSRAIKVKLSSSAYVEKTIHQHRCCNCTSLQQESPDCAENPGTGMVASWAVRKWCCGTAELRLSYLFSMLSATSCIDAHLLNHSHSDLCDTCPDED